ncbi:MAG: hypothetical protein ABF530_10030 [Acetobacter orientalis]|uniref:hypothetical protein n=1 Tax=Acetobacter orientalis TaxID=146474 RepID=UPI0039EB4A75
MSKTVITLKQAESPNKQAMLDLLDGLKGQVESGDVISLMALAAHPDKEFSNYSAGELGSLETIGMLERHKLSLMLKLS